ncbi:hypothetical protein EON82_02180 [bacterium]|nr:MAG: hypothetical protein EON82_02180 [bacterium]
MNTLLLAIILNPPPPSPSAKCCSGVSYSADLCPICGLDVLKDTPDLDNNVVLSRGDKKTAYRCVLCAIADAKTDSRDVVIETPSEKKGKWVKILRTAGKWTVQPETAQFAYIKGSHSQCEIRYRALTKKAAFEAYVATKPKLLANAKLIPLDEMVKRSE